MLSYKDFTNNDAIYDDNEKIVFESGNPVFSHFIIYPQSFKLIAGLPFDITFNDSRPLIIAKTGAPAQTK